MSSQGLHQNSSGLSLLSLKISRTLTTIICQTIMASRSNNEAHKASGSDGIFRLPAEILQKIFFFQPVPDSLSLSATAKTLRSAWTSLPVHNFTFIHNDENTLLEDFLSSTERSLSTLRSQSAIIETFSLTVNSPPQERSRVSHLLHEWLSLVMKNYVKEVDVRVYESPENNDDIIFCTLPKSLFNSKSLVKLHLIGFKFPSDISPLIDHECMCLKEITLEDIAARNDQIRDLVNRSRKSLEKLSIRTFPPIDLLNLKSFPKLVFLEVNVLTLHVDQAINLGTLVLYGIQSVCAFGVWNVSTLKCLIWDAGAFKWIKELISSLPFLEMLQLSTARNENIKIESLSLKTFSLCECRRLEEPIIVEIDAPRLREILVTGFSFPEITMSRVSEKVYLHHFGHSSGGIDSSQLFRLGDFSQNLFNPFLEIHLHRIGIQVSF